MALIKLGALAADIRGSIGGETFARNRSGLYCRSRVKPINPQSERQQLVRNTITTLQAAFRDTLTDAQRKAWLDLAKGTVANNKLGESITLTGQNLFIKINSILVQAGEALLAEAPTGPATIAPSAWTYTGATANGIRLSAESPAQGAGDVLVTQISPACNATINFFKGPWETIVYNVGALTPPVTLLASANVTIGDRFFIRSRLVTAEGKISPYVQTHLDIAA